MTHSHYPSFLNDLERVTSTRYMPNDGNKYCATLVNQLSDISQWIDDVLKARLKTVGVSEYRFEMEAAAGRESGTEWRIIDVGGSRSQVCHSHRLFIHSPNGLFFFTAW